MMSSYKFYYRLSGHLGIPRLIYFQLESAYENVKSAKSAHIFDNNNNILQQIVFAVNRSNFRSGTESVNYRMMLAVLAHQNQTTHSATNPLAYLTIVQHANDKQQQCHATSHIPLLLLLDVFN